MDANSKSAAEPGFADQIRGIRDNAELVIRMFSKETDFIFGYDSASVKWLDEYIEHIRHNPWTEEEFNQLVSNLGSYLGEAIIRSFGGEWTMDQRGWAIRWDEYNLVYPFIKVARHLKHGETDSIYSFYAVTGAMRKS